MDDVKEVSQNASSAGGQPDSQKIELDDEKTLMYYLSVLWKWRHVIILGSVLPALVVGLVFLLLPRNYTVTFVYEQSLTEKDYNVLLDRFHSAGNLDKLTKKLRENGLDKYAKKIAKARKSQSLLEELVKFEVSPSYPKRLKTTDPATSEEISSLEARLLHIVITGRPKKDVPAIAAVITSNFESIIPLYFVKREINSAVRMYKDKIADIEQGRFDLELRLDKEKATLAKLKNIKPDDFTKGESNIILEFDISGKTEYLPVEYQIQAAETKLIHLQEQVATDEAKYDYYKDLLALTQKLFAELKHKADSCYTIQQFHSFLTGLVDNYNNKELQDYLSSYIKRIENRISVSSPVAQKPEVYAVTRGTVKNIASVFAILLMISVFAAFLLEDIQKGRGKMS